MGNDKMKPEQRKGLPGGFFLFLIAIVLLVLTFQNMSAEKTAKVAFSYQLEHLVNLDLIQSEESRKISLNDNLVTFSGKFKDKLSEDSKARYRYLELLEKNHELTADKSRISTELTTLKQNVIDASDLFLHVSGLPIPKGGYRVVDSIYSMQDLDQSIVIRSLSDRSIVSLADLESSVPSADNAQAMDQYAKDLIFIIEAYRSPALGIGNQTIKDTLKNVDQAVRNAARSTTMTGKERLAVYTSAIGQLQSITDELNESKDDIRLIELRSVRSYKMQLDQFAYVNDELEKNTVQLDKAREQVAQVIWYFNNKELSTRALEKEDPEVYSHWFAQAKQEWDAYPQNKGFFFKAPDQPRNIVLEKTFKSQEPSPNYLSYFFTLLPVLLVVFLLYFVFSRQMKGMGSGAMSFGKAPARMMTKDQNKVTFKDVAGCDEAKEELQEIVDFLKDPSKFTALGARIPKGVLCIGAPGTGKTLIAKAVAGEADRPFFSISGSDFVEMFVGVGASRIRDLFDQAKKNAPCIIFMDEIDAVGRHRGAGIGGGHDEREQTLNQLLVEMDGFDTTEGVILIAATNRPDVLDKALLRPGRFDRRVVIDLPDIKGRYEILKVHARKIKLDASVDLMDIARNTPGASGADLANMLNEAALLAARKGRKAVTAQDAMESADKVKYGKERRSLEIDQSEKRTTAYHESGHAIVALLVQHADPVEKVTIIPRGLSLGATHFMPKKNRLSYWKKELVDQLAVLMGGRVAEEIFVGDVSSGAQMDIAQATKLVRSMVCEWGMNETLGLVAYDERSEGGQYLGVSGYQEKNYSEETAKQIDVEVRKFMEAAHKYAHEIISSHREQVELMTQMLMDFETLDREDVLDIINNRWDVEKKKERVKMYAELQKKPQAAAPIPSKDLASNNHPSPQPS